MALPFCDHFEQAGGLESHHQMIAGMTQRTNTRMAIPNIPGGETHAVLAIHALTAQIIAIFFANGARTEHMITSQPPV